MIKEFDGKTEKEAIQKAVDELGLQQDEFDVEIVNSEKGFLFKKGITRIRVHLDSDDEAASEGSSEMTIPVLEKKNLSLEEASEEELEINNFVCNVVKKMGYECEVSLEKREDGKLVCNITSDSSAIIIGRKGKNLDALQLLANVYAGKISKGKDSVPRVVVDTEDYRLRREENLIRLAGKAAEQVVRTKKSKLLEPMNPFERRLIHTALNENHDILTKSEGEGLIKQVRIIYKGSR